MGPPRESSEGGRGFPMSEVFLHRTGADAQVLEYMNMHHQLPQVRGGAYTGVLRSQETPTPL